MPLEMLPLNNRSKLRHAIFYEATTSIGWTTENYNGDAKGRWDFTLFIPWDIYIGRVCKNWMMHSLKEMMLVVIPDVIFKCFPLNGVILEKHWRVNLFVTTINAQQSISISIRNMTWVNVAYRKQQLFFLQQLAASIESTALRCIL